MARLELDRLTRRFGTLTALDGLSFDVGPGQLFGFVGANGAGKTTTMRIIMGVDDADGGEVRFDDQRVDRRRRGRFGYMPEERGLYPKVPPVRQLAFLARLHGSSAAEATTAARTWLDRLGLADRGAEPLENLSLGNQQRVQLAAALVHEPDLLVLDEPFSGLDPVGVDALSEILQERAATGVPVLFSSHQLELVERLCDAVAIIDAGRLVASGGVRELREADRRPVWRVEVATDRGGTDRDGTDRDGTDRGGTDRDGFDRGGPSNDWTASLPGVEVLARTGDSVLVQLTDGTDEVALLDAARAAGRVRHFGTELPTLAELYREVVTRDDDPPPATAEPPGDATSRPAPGRGGGR